LALAVVAPLLTPTSAAAFDVALAEPLPVDDASDVPPA
jgi:hypothetical protein